MKKLGEFAVYWLMVAWLVVGAAIVLAVICHFADRWVGAWFLPTCAFLYISTRIAYDAWAEGDE